MKDVVKRSMNVKQYEHTCRTNDDERKQLQLMLQHLPLETLENWFKGLADGTRIKIAYLLMEHGEMCVHDVAEVLSVSIANASHHLRLMKQLGLAKQRKQGTSVFYSLDDRHVRDILALALTHVEEEN